VFRPPPTLWVPRDRTARLNGSVRSAVEPFEDARSKRVVGSAASPHVEPDDTTFYLIVYLLPKKLSPGRMRPSRSSEKSLPLAPTQRAHSELLGDDVSERKLPVVTGRNRFCRSARIVDGDHP